MRKPLADIIRDVVVATLPEGEVKFKFRAKPDLRGPRRVSPIKNKSSKPEYFSDTMQERRDNGQDCQKGTEHSKKLKREQKKRLKEKFDLK